MHAPFQTGDVWLVGAGPGDPGLLTRQAERLLRSADVVFGDALVGPGVRALIPAHAKQVPVGKRSRRQSYEQDEINAMIVAAALAGARAVQEVLARSGADKVDIVMFGAEPYVNYNRILLSNILRGVSDPAYIFMNPLDWYVDNNIVLHAGHHVTSIDCAARRRSRRRDAGEGNGEDGGHRPLRQIDDQCPAQRRWQHRRPRVQGRRQHRLRHDRRLRRDPPQC